MPGMPYHFEKGPWLSVLEDYLNDKDRRLEALRLLRDVKEPLAGLEFFKSPALQVESHYPDEDSVIRHIRDDWFGKSAAGAPDFIKETIEALGQCGLGNCVKTVNQSSGQSSDREHVVAFAKEVIQAVSKNSSGALDGWPNTGFWFQYHGNVQWIVRETLIRAIEVSLGIDHVPQKDRRREQVPDNPPRFLPIEFFWKCPQRWFEGWITWRWGEAAGETEEAQGAESTGETEEAQDAESTERIVAPISGHVKVMFATPGSGQPLLERVGQGASELVTKVSDADRKNMKVAGPDQAKGSSEHIGAGHAALGMWVVTHEDHVVLPTPPASTATTGGDWIVPPFGPSYVGVGPVICVQPSESDGGVNPFGRPYQERNIKHSPKNVQQS